MVSTLYTCMKDVSSIFLQLLEEEFNSLTNKKDQMNIETKIRNIRFIGELCKFKIAPAGMVFSCLKVLEEIRLGLELNDYGMQQKRVAVMRFLGELECPEDCKEVVSSLMFKKTRFADLPELRESRTLFLENYVDSMNYYANKEKLKSGGSPSEDTKLQLLQDIASEYGLQWNS